MISYFYLLLLFLGSRVSFLTCTSFVTNEVWALTTFKESIYEDPHLVFSNWNALDADPCDWPGITCNQERQHVIKINISGSSLQGFLPPEMGQITYLEGLTLHENNLIGRIPTELGMLAFLQVLDLGMNQLTGHIPPALGNLTRVMKINLQSNGLTGSLPDVFGYLMQLQELRLDNNKLQGTIPADSDSAFTAKSNGTLSRLKVLDVSYNYFVGSIPKCLESLPSASFQGNCLQDEETKQRSSTQCGNSSGHGAGNSSGHVAAGNSSGHVAAGNSSGHVAGNASGHVAGNSYGFAIKVAVGSSIAGVVVLIILGFMMKKIASIMFKKKTEQDKKIEAFLKGFEFQAPKRYKYSDIKSITNSFQHKLGKGGYGEVYKGKLLDGRDVAVKVLNKSAANGEEFINEVASISRTSHINIVTLLGFCFEGHRRALIYEFVPNGSLEKFIYGDMTDQRQLNWETLYRIAVGIARGLEYLHCGCNMRILHFDIKPHNILLDDNFCPKISDFGLAKLCPGKESAISMTGARGTAGYIAPEVYSRNFGKASHKSDVYSYGMMILEMVGGRKNINAEVDCTSEIYFPHWIYSRIELDQELGLLGISDEDDQKKARKMIITGLWCIQTDPANRPSMSRVVEMVEGDVGSLDIPPKPFFS